MCVSCITYLFILIFFFSHFLVLLSLLCVCLSLSEHLPLYWALIGRKRLLVDICSECVVVAVVFSSAALHFMCSSSHRNECSVWTTVRMQCAECVRVGEMPVAPMYELVRCTRFVYTFTHFTIAVCAHTLMARCRKFTLRLLYKGRQVPCRSHIRTCLRRANNSLSFSWVLWKNWKIKIHKHFYFAFSFDQCKREI